MKKIKLIIASILICLLTTQILVCAAPDSSTLILQNEKKKVALIVVNDPESDVRQKEQDNLWMNPISQNLSERYNVSVDQKYYEKFKAAGYPSVTDAERSDIIDILKDDNLDYAILIDFFHSYTTDFETTYYMQMKIVDIKTNKNIYTGKFTRRGKVKPLADQMITVVTEKLM